MGQQRRWDGVGSLHGKAGPPDSRGDTAPQLWGHLSQSREHSHGTDRQTCLLPPAFNCGSWAGGVLGGPEAASSMGEAGGDRAIPVRGCTSRGRRPHGTPPGHPSASWWSLGRQRHRTEQGTAEPPSLSAHQQDGGDEFICWIYNDWSPSLLGRGHPCSAFPLLLQRGTECWAVHTCQAGWFLLFLPIGK